MQPQGTPSNRPANAQSKPIPSTAKPATSSSNTDINIDSRSINHALMHNLLSNKIMVVLPNR